MGRDLIVRAGLRFARGRRLFTPAHWQRIHAAAGKPSPRDKVAEQAWRSALILLEKGLERPSITMLRLARTEFARAAVLDPGMADAYLGLYLLRECRGAIELMRSGELARASQWLARAKRSVRYHAVAARCLYLTSELGEVLYELRRVSSYRDLRLLMDASAYLDPETGWLWLPDSELSRAGFHGPRGDLIVGCAGTSTSCRAATDAADAGGSRLVDPEKPVGAPYQAELPRE